MDFTLAFLRIRKLLSALRTRQTRRALRLGVAPSIEHLALLRHISPSSVVDVGANGGQFALAVRAVAPAASIFCFEPGKVAFGRLTLVFADDPKVKLFRSAIAPEIGRMRLNVTEADDSSSLLPVGDTQARVFGTLVNTVEEVEAGPLDTFISRDAIRSPALLKIDVQGFEGEVVTAARGLAEFFDWIYVECSFAELYTGQSLAPDIIRDLEKLGFELAGVYNQVTAQGFAALQADLLFRQRRSSPL
jgi:FkbM family methyltransferase